MIQVGLDVPRLSLMTVVGQPKTTSEYIQASSRIGRSAKRPGLVVVNYSASKPRDRSHFEHFRQYHQSIYRWVEPTSVTPFALPVCDRALHAVIIALARIWGPNTLGISPVPAPDDALRAQIKKAILDRVQITDPSETSYVEIQIDKIFEKWGRGLASKYGEMVLADQAEPVPLMYPYGAKPYEEWIGRSVETLTSMRSVDSDCEANIIALYPNGDEDTTDV
jgi:hypothetical protein